MPDRADAPDPQEKLRVDKWLWQARFFKSRALADEMARSGKLRINAERCQKSAHPVKPGDTLTFPQGTCIRLIRVEAIGTRRGPATEAQTLYTDLDPPAAAEPGEERPKGSEEPPAKRAPGSGRPSKRERREIDALRRLRS